MPSSKKNKSHAASAVKTKKKSPTTTTLLQTTLLSNTKKRCGDLENNQTACSNNKKRSLERESSVIIVAEVQNPAIITTTTPTKAVAASGMVAPLSPSSARGSAANPLEIDDDCPVLICSDQCTEKIDMEQQGVALVGAPEWKILSTLGDGAYGDVKLVRHAVTQQLRACKIIKSEYSSKYAEDIKREIQVQKVLSYERIVKFYEHKQTLSADYLFLEYIPGGELFDRISPDFGMPEQEAQRLFRQLIDCVEYMHGQGIVHRDIKPENLLLDSNDNLKITDFGFASIFRSHGAERKVRKRCGTLPYTAPEVFRLQSFEAAPLDVWSCGVVLIAMLTGELPWDKPQDDCEDFLLYSQNKYFGRTPWNRFSNPQLQLITNMLHIIVTKRWTMSQVKTSRWFVLNLSTSAVNSVAASVHRIVGAAGGGSDKKRRRVLKQPPSAESMIPSQSGMVMSSPYADEDEDDVDGDTADVDDDLPQTFDKPPEQRYYNLRHGGSVIDIGGTQPALMLRDNHKAGSKIPPVANGGRVNAAAERLYFVDGAVSRAAFSQPVQKFDDMVLSQLGATSSGKSNNAEGGKRPMWQNLVKRMTRFFVRKNMRAQDAFDALKAACHELEMDVRSGQQGVLTISTKDRRKNQLAIKATLIDIKGRLFFDFRLSKGDGIEFKRKFLQIRQAMTEKNVVDEFTPVSYMNST